MPDRTCSETDCTRKVVARNLCGKHYQQWRKEVGVEPGGDLPDRPPLDRPVKPCSIDGCDRPAKSRGWCSKHYEHLRPRPECIVEGCPGRQKANGYCSLHYSRDYKKGDPLSEPYPTRYCDIEDCDGVHVGLGLCGRHYQAKVTHGDPLASEGRVRGSAEERIFQHLAFGTQKHDGTFCLEWQLVPARTGYATTGDNGVTIYVHRWMYDRWVGPIPEGLHIDHLCMNKICCNVLHLEPVTTQENTRRYWASPAGRKRAARGSDPAVRTVG